MKKVKKYAGWILSAMLGIALAAMTRCAIYYHDEAEALDKSIDELVLANEKPISGRYPWGKKDDEEGNAQ